MSETSPFDRAKAIVVEIATARLNFPIVKDERDLGRLALHLQDNLPNTLHYQISSLETVKELWADIRSEPLFCAFVCHGTTELVARLQSEGILEPLVTSLAIAMSALKVNETEEYAGIDETLSGDCPTREVALNILSQNPWLIFHYMLASVGAEEISNKLIYGVSLRSMARGDKDDE